VKFCPLNEKCLFKRNGKCLLINPEAHCPKRRKPLLDYDDYDEEEWWDND
jgi:hypothetical protein